jgi:hypothetical protein
LALVTQIASIIAKHYSEKLSKIFSKIETVSLVIFFYINNIGDIDYTPWCSIECFRRGECEVTKTCNDCIHCDICNINAKENKSVCNHFNDRSNFLYLGKPVYIINQGSIAEFVPCLPTIYLNREDAEHALKEGENHENL